MSGRILNDSDSDSLLKASDHGSCGRLRNQILVSVLTALYSQSLPCLRPPSSAARPFG